MFYRLIIASITVSTVSGCILSSNGTTEDVAQPEPEEIIEEEPYDTTEDVFTTDLTIPVPENVAGPVGAVYADYLQDNAGFAPTETLQTGAATYEGRFAFGFTGGNDRTVAGDMRLAMNFDGATLSGAMENILVYEADGTSQDTDNHVLTVAGDAAGNTIHADIRGHLHVDNGTWVVNAHTHGALGGRNGEVALGDIDGEVEYAIGDAEGIAGLYVLDRQQ